MAYATANNPNRNLPTLGLVALLHLGAAVALVNGLAGGIFKPRDDPPFVGGTVPTESHPDKPKPKPQPEQKTSLTDATETTVVAPLDPGPIVLDPLIPTFPLDPGSSGLTDADFGDRPPPPVEPTFKPRPPRARGNTGLWVTTTDYPSRDLKDEHEGITRARLSVNADGRVTACEIAVSSGWPGLDAMACRRLSERARFDPATDESGGATSGSYATSVRWQLPRE